MRCRGATRTRSTVPGPGLLCQDQVYCARTEMFLYINIVTIHTQHPLSFHHDLVHVVSSSLVCDQIPAELQTLPSAPAGLWA